MLKPYVTAAVKTTGHLYRVYSSPVFMIFKNVWASAFSKRYTDVYWAGRQLYLWIENVVPIWNCGKTSNDHSRNPHKHKYTVHLKWLSVLKVTKKRKSLPTLRQMFLWTKWSEKSVLLYNGQWTILNCFFNNIWLCIKYISPLTTWRLTKNTIWSNL